MTNSAYLVRPDTPITQPAIDVPSIERFNVAEKIVDGENGCVVTPDFQKYFYGKIEEAPASKLYPLITTHARYLEAREKLGKDADCIKTTIGAIFALTQAQPKGEEGVFFANNLANLFEADDIEGVRRLVFVRYFGNSCFWGAAPIDYSSPGNFERKVFSAIPIRDDVASTGKVATFAVPQKKRRIMADEEN